MFRPGLLLATLSVFAVASLGSNALAAPPGTRSTAAANEPRATLEPFRTDAQLKRYLKRMERARPKPVALAVPVPSPAPPAPSAAPSADAAAPAEAVSVTGSKAENESITNTQEANVDEGGIVKMHGSTLVILRRGRLFTVATGDGALKPVDSINAWPPGADSRNDWYDEMLVSGDRVIVIGYSYGRGGTEINRFRIDKAGRLSFEDAYHLRSNDYYSSRNYASRLIGTKLIVYSPLDLPYADAERMNWLPALRRWTGRETPGEFRRIVSARQIYIPEAWLEGNAVEVEALHTVTSCDLAAEVLACSASSVLGPNGRTFYVSSHAVYVWVSQYSWRRPESARAPASLLYRLPLDGSAPSAIGVRGSPIDQFSFREDWNDGRLNVLVRSDSSSDAMWRPEFTSGAVALLQLRLNRFGDGSGEAPLSSYRSLPKPSPDSYSVQNRFVGNYLLYGSGSGWGAPQDGRSKLVAAAVNASGRIDDGGVTTIDLPHGIDRIEAMGNDAVVVGGSARSLNFSAVELTAGPSPLAGERYVLESASQGETRSHAFFFKPDPRTENGDTTSGVLGLPVAREARPAYRHLIESSAAMLFLRRTDRKFVELGELPASQDGIVDDACTASCVDWYGNARPIFLRDRTFALMGYEIVEGRLASRTITEVRRVNFAPVLNEREKRP